MAVFIRRAKRVTDPLDDRVKAQLTAAGSYASSSSSSDHEGTASEFSCLSNLVHNFLVDENPNTSEVTHDGEAKRADSDDEHRHAEAADVVLKDMLGVFKRSDKFRLKLLSDVSGAAFHGGAGGRWNLCAVVARLRELGYNAGLCRARWETCGGLVAGSYEYVDVVTKEKRYIIDLGFAGECEIARASEEYTKAVAELPAMMVGTAEEIRQVLRVLGDAARRSLRRAGMHVPPWRKTRYMLAKWLGPYIRTINAIRTPAVNSAGEVKCRAVGFHAAVAVAPPFIPPVGRTR